MCLRRSRIARPSASKNSISNSPWRNITLRTSKSEGVDFDSLPANAATKSANNHGRPRQPRPTTTPAQPVSSIIRTPSCPDQISPLPKTGTPVGFINSTNLAIADQSAWPSYICDAKRACNATQATPASAAALAAVKYVS